MLISGGADTGVLALVIAALGTRAISSDFTYIDICKTPVEQNTLMATKLGLNAVILHGDVLDLDIEQVDAVVAHNFVSFFPPELRQRLFRKWFEALKPGGVALIANNASRYSGAKRPNRKGRDISKALSSLHAGALSWGMTSNEAAELIELTTLREYDQTRFPHLAIDEFKSEFIAAGFEVELVASDEDGKSLVPNAFLREESDLERESKRSVKSVFQLRRPFSVN
ncbi:MAG: class I SAM-dependent methyltransferase [Pseudomonadota bacterium]